MAEYKLIYFDFKGRGETIRLLFEIAGVKYEDIRIDREEWNTNPECKAKINAPFGQMPILETPEGRLCQCHTIEKYVAKKFGLVGSTDWEEARCDMIVNCVEDMVQKVLPIIHEKDPARKEATLAKFLEYRDQALDNLNKILEENSSGYFVGNGLTYADVVMYHYPLGLDYFSQNPIDWSKWPKLNALRERVGKIERVADWVRRRPVTDL